MKLLFLIHINIIILIFGIFIVFIEQRFGFKLLLKLKHILIIFFVLLLLFFLIDFSVFSKTGPTDGLAYLNYVVASYNKSLSPQVPPLVLSPEQINIILENCSTESRILDIVCNLFDEHIKHYVEFKYAFNYYVSVWNARLKNIGILVPLVFTDSEMYTILINCTTINDISIAVHHEFQLYIIHYQRRLYYLTYLFSFYNNFFALLGLNPIVLSDYIINDILTNCLTDNSILNAVNNRFKIEYILYRIRTDVKDSCFFLLNALDEYLYKYFFFQLLRLIIFIQMDKFEMWWWRRQRERRERRERERRD